jgi:hypothetical protein
MAQELLVHHQVLVVQAERMVQAQQEVVMVVVARVLKIQQQEKEEMEHLELYGVQTDLSQALIQQICDNNN